VSVRLSYPADLQAMTAYEVRPLEAKGVITYLKVDKGDRVRKGQLLVRVDCPEFHARRRRIVHWLSAAKAQYGQAKVTYERVAPMARENFISPRELDQAQADRDTTEARVKNNEARLKEIDHLLEYCSIRAPFAGEVVMRWADPGGLVRPGGAPLLSLVKRDAMRLQLQVVERDVAQVKEGKGVELEVNGLQGRVFEGEVTRVASMLDPRTRTFIVEVTVPNRDKALQPGMYGRASLTVAERKRGLIVPASAVLATDAGRWLYVVKDGIARRTPVELGYDTGEEIEIRKGLRADDTIVVAGRDLIGDGAPVRAFVRP
jgi:membrane fusion protein, multidrug efflux system